MRRFSMLVLSVLLASSGFCDDESDLLNSIEQTTTLATKTRINVDNVPGTMTVIKGSSLREQGILTLEGALNTIPGVNVGSNDSLIMRGIIGYSSGKVKILINGVPFNDSIISVSSSVYQLPIEMIDRIEVIRGPASSIYGEYAFSGVIDVITISKDSIWSNAGIVGHQATTNIGANTTGTFNGWKTSLNLSMQKSDGANINSGPDSLPSNVSNSPGLVNNKTKSENFILNTGNNDTTINFLHVKNGTGDGFGMLNYLPNYKRIVDTQTTDTIELKHTHKLGDVNLDTSVGFSNFQFEKDNVMLVPANVLVKGQSMSTSFGTVEHRFYGNTTASVKVEDHQVSLGLGIDKIKLVDTYTKANWDQLTLEPTAMVYVSGTNQWLNDSKAKRDIYHVMIQDQWKLGQFTLVAGTRFDSYSDIGNSVSPRFSVVYQRDEENIVKGQLSSSFRPPTFLEMYSSNMVINPSLHITKEHIDTAELAYIHKFNDGTFKINSFVSSLKDMINLTTVDGYQSYSNATDVSMYGFESEVMYKWQSLMFNTTFSYVKTKDKNTGTDLAGSSNIGSNFSVTYNAGSYLFNVSNKFTGEVHRVPGDFRPDIGKSFITNATLTIPVNNFRIVGSVHNIFDVSTYEYSDMNSYVNDYPNEGRFVFLHVAYDF